MDTWQTNFHADPNMHKQERGFFYPLVPLRMQQGIVNLNWISTYIGQVSILMLGLPEVQMKEPDTTSKNPMQESLGFHTQFHLAFSSVKAGAG